MGQEYTIGNIVSSKANYEKAGGSSIPTPTWDQLLDKLVEIKVQDLETFDIMFVGMAGSDKQFGSTGFGPVTKRDVQRQPIRVWDPSQGPIKLLTQDPGNTNAFATHLLDLKRPALHITGIVIRTR
jgi:hypothetical protein